MIPAALLGLGAQAGLGVVGEILAGMDDAQAEALIKQATDQYGNINLPQLKQMVAEQLGPSELTRIQADPELAAAQKEALGELMSVGRSGGLRLQDRAAMNAAMNAASRTASAGYNRIREDRAARGVSDSGSDLLLGMKGAQDAAQRASDAGLRAAGDAQQRALDAMLAGGRLAGDIRGQDYGEKSRAAEATDAIRKYNAEGRMRATEYNNGVAQQQFGNQMQVADRQAQGYRDQAQMKRDAAQGKRQMFGGLGSAAARGGQAYDNYQRDQSYEDYLKKNGGY